MIASNQLSWAEMQGLPRFLIEGPPIHRTEGCVVRECRGVAERPSPCSRGQGEEAVCGVPGQQPLGHRRRGCSGAGGDSDRRHPLLETLPHGQVGLSAWHGGQHSAASEGRAHTSPAFTQAVLWAGVGWVQALDTGRWELVENASGLNGGASLSLHVCLLRPQFSCGSKYMQEDEAAWGLAVLWALKSTVILFLRTISWKITSILCWILISFNPGYFQRTGALGGFLESVCFFHTLHWRPPLFSTHALQAYLPTWIKTA